MLRWGEPAETRATTSQFQDAQTAMHQPTGWAESTRHAPVVKSIKAPDDVTARGLLDVRALVVENLCLHLREALV